MWVKNLDKTRLEKLTSHSSSLFILIVEEAEKHYRNGRAIIRQLENDNFIRADGTFLASTKVAEMLKKALHLFNLAFQIGHDDAAYFLAESAFWGTYQAINHVTAKEYYTFLAAKGNATAHQRLGFLYSFGLNMAVEPAKASTEKTNIGYIYRY